MLQDSPQPGNTKGPSDPQLGTELANSATAGCKSYKHRLVHFFPPSRNYPAETVLMKPESRNVTVVISE